MTPSSESDHIRELLDQWQKDHLDRHRAEEHARQLAVTEINRRLDEMNELRAQITRERGTYVQREWFERIHDNTDKDREALRDEMHRIKGETDRAIKSIENTIANFEGRIWMLGAFMTAIVVGLNLLLKYWK
jgi:hypothetical protein